MAILTSKTQPSSGPSGRSVASPLIARAGQIPVLNLKRVQVQQGDRLVGAVAVEALDGGSVTLEILGMVPVTVYHRLWADCPCHLGQQALYLREG